MKRKLAQALAVLLIFAFAVPVLANDSASSPKQMQMMGTIKNVDTASNTVTVEDKTAKEMTYNVDQATAITVGGEKVTLADLKVGQAVKVSVSGNRALSIEA